MRVGYLGPRGTFTEQAARRYLERGESDRDSELIPFRTIPEMLFAVQTGDLDAAVAPIENSIEGSVAVTVDALIHEVDLQIRAEVVLPVVHHLMALPGTALEDVKAVLSHPQALAQCRKTLDKLLPGRPHLAATSTAEAAQQVARGDEGAGRLTAALGTRLAAELYGLEIIASNLQDLKDNATRFVAVGRTCAPRTGRDKTSLVFSFSKDRPGNLYRALGVFAERDINLTKLESRPAKGALGDYLFLVDLEGHLSDPIVREALDEIRSQSAFFKVLGAYPRVDYHNGENGI